jgi:CRISPR-associated protein Csb1
MSELSRFDKYLNDDGPAALVIREYLMPIEGSDGVLFPPTFAPTSDADKGGYNIDPDPNGRNVERGVDAAAGNVCLVDSVGAQANRIEPIFKGEKYKHLVPQIVVTAGDKEVNLLDAGHRAGDALVRCSALQSRLQTAFKAVLSGDAAPLGEIAPTSLVFGVWDSRDTQAKLPRVIASTIRAFKVQELTRSAQYNPPLDYAALDVFSEEEKAKAEGNTKSPLAQRGFVHVPATGHGGVIAEEVRRDATLGLIPIRLLHAGKDEKRQLALRRYILGLSLVAFTHNPAGYLRQGCLLVRNPDKAGKNEFVEVYSNGDRKPVAITHDVALAYATVVAEAFGVGKNETVPFDKERAKADVKKDEKKKPAKKGTKAGEQPPEDQG